MSGPPPPVAAVRVAVRRSLADLPAGALVLAACSGGADSLALADALAYEARPAGLRAGLVTVDHHLQPGSADVAARVRQWGEERGLAPAERLDAAPAPASAAAGGPEDAARRVRYAALDAAADRLGAAAVLLGHTRDDQAETVLLGLARGSGARSLAGMAAVRGRYRRPLLDLDRATTRAACAAAGLPVWDDPHNTDVSYARVRARRVLADLEAALPGVTVGLARSARLLRDDADALDAAARDAAAALGGDGEGPPVAALAALPAAVRRRVLRAWMLAAGAPAGSLAAAHVDAVEALVERWRGQGPVALPGGLAVSRTSGRLAVAKPRREEQRVQGSATEPLTGSAVARPTVGPEAGAYAGDIESVLVDESAIQAKIAELAAAVSADYAGRDILLVGVLKGAVMFMADLARALTRPVTMEFMAVSSYGSSTSSSGVVRILKDLDRDIAGRHVLVVEDIIDSGLTLSWLLKNLTSRQPASLEVVALLRKPEALRVDVDVRYVGFDIPDEFVVGYGLDYAERYRDLRFVGTLRPEVYAGG